MLNQAAESRREQLIDRLIAHHVYKKNGKHLFELSLSELEREYQNIRAKCSC
ncbi:Fur-regulated basic protein FbpA [Sporolactobacillus sp. CPB3-1]|uniref:Fur-regulated basic protein FbpA n=1 Tax=Sporolactobacillus mangiferae TaxID=2940498 RepID=A0ABT0MAS2_9BACL|nr:Fur-regulated basic protein FbpA [Sporolactobacillus mangiferae]